jgi:hypothetical protein
MAAGFMVGARHVTSWPRPQVPLILSHRVSDPYSFATGPDPDPIRIPGFMTKNWKEFTAEKIFFGSKTTI